MIEDLHCAEKRKAANPKAGCFPFNKITSISYPGIIILNGAGGHGPPWFVVFTHLANPYTRCPVWSAETIDNAELGNLTQLVDQIKPAITGDSTNAELMMDETSKNNVKMTIADILKGSPVIEELVNENKVKIVGAYYDIASGRVTFFE